MASIKKKKGGLIYSSLLRVLGIKKQVYNFRLPNLKQIAYFCSFMFGKGHTITNNKLKNWPWSNITNKLKTNEHSHTRDHSEKASTVCLKINLSLNPFNSSVNCWSGKITIYTSAGIFITPLLGNAMKMAASKILYWLVESFILQRLLGFLVHCLYHSTDLRDCGGDIHS